MQSKKTLMKIAIPTLLTAALSLQALPVLAEEGIPSIGALCFDEEGKVFVEAVAPGSTADKAGLQVGDMILSLDGMPVHSAGAVGTKILGSRKDSLLRCSILRGAYDATPLYGISNDPGRLGGQSLVLNLPVAWLNDAQATKYNRNIREYNADKIRMFDAGSSPIYLKSAFPNTFRQGSESFDSFWGFAELEKRASRYPILDEYSPLFQGERTRGQVALGSLGFAGLCLVLAPFSGGGDLGGIIVGSMLAGLGVAGVAGVMQIAKGTEVPEAAKSLVHVYNRSLWREITASGSVGTTIK